MEKIFGLVGQKKPEAIIFFTRFGIHTFFMQFYIDVLILDKSKKVMSLKENLKPNRVFFWNPKYNTVLELPSGSIKKSKTQAGDLLEFSL